MSCWSPFPAGCPHPLCTCTKAAQSTTVAQGSRTAPSPRQAQFLNFQPRKALLKAPGGTWQLCPPGWDGPGQGPLLLPWVQPSRARPSSHQGAEMGWAGLPRWEPRALLGCSALANPTLLSGSLKSRAEPAQPLTSAPGKQQHTDTGKFGNLMPVKCAFN